MITLFMPIVLGVALWVVWKPMKAAVSRDKAESDLQYEEMREGTMEVQAELNVKTEDNNKEQTEIKL